MPRNADRPSISFVSVQSSSSSFSFLRFHFLPAEMKSSAPLVQINWPQNVSTRRSAYFRPSARPSVPILAHWGGRREVFRPATRLEPAPERGNAAWPSSFLMLPPPPPLLLRIFYHRSRYARAAPGALRKSQRQRCRRAPESRAKRLSRRTRHANYK